MQQFIEKYRLHYIIFLFLIASMLCIRVCLILSYSLDLDGLEYYFLHLTKQIASGKPLYTNPEAFPYSNCLYTPVFFYVYNAILNLLQFIIDFFSAKKILSYLYLMLIIGRLFSFICVLLILYFLTKIVRRFKISNFQLLLLITMFLLLITGHIYAVRPDSLKILFFILFLYFITEGLFYSKKLLYGILAVISSVLAVYCKQDISVHISIVFLTSIYIDRSKKSVNLFLLFLISCAAIFIILYSMYGHIFISNIILFNLQTITNIWKSYNILFLILSIIRTAPLLYLTFKNYKKLWSTDTPINAEKFIVLSTFFLYVISHISFFRPGANFNYTYELIIFLVINIAIYFKLHEENIRFQSTKHIKMLSVYVLFMLASNMVPQTYFIYKKKVSILKEEYYTCLAEKKEIENIIKDDTVFFPNTKYAIYFDDRQVVLGHDMHLDKFVKLYTPFHIESKLTFINTNKYDENFKNGTVKFIIVQNDKKSAAHVKAYYPDYSAYKATSFYSIYKFKELNQ